MVKNFKIMKTILLFSPLLFFGQEKTIEIYGIKDLTPQTVIEVKQDKKEVYNVNSSGVKELTPSQVIINNQVYEVKNGVQQLVPSVKIEEKPKK